MTSSPPTEKEKMERHRLYMYPGASYKLYHVHDPVLNTTTHWDPITGLAAEDASTVPANEAALFQSITDYFRNQDSRPHPTPYITAVLRSLVDVETLKRQVGEGVLVLEINVEKMPEPWFYPIAQINARYDLDLPIESKIWRHIYLFLHRVPREAITVYTPDALLEKGEFCL